MKINILTLLLLFLSLTAFSQEDEGSTKIIVEEDSTINTKEKKEKKIKVPYRPSLTGVKLGADLYPLMFSIFEKDFMGYEFNSELVFDNKFFVNLDVGAQDANREDEDKTFLYTNKGTYWRLGLDYNFMHKKFSQEALFIGGRFGNTSFDHSASYSNDTETWGSSDKVVEVSNLSASWMELNFGMKVKVIGNLHLSAILRGKFLLSSPSDELLSVVEMPGFGINRNSVTGSIGYRVAYLFPIKKNSTKKSPKLKSKGDKADNLPNPIEE